MMRYMRTTLTIDDSIAAELKKRSYETQKSFKHVVNETLAAGLRQSTPPGQDRIKIGTVSLGSPLPGIDLGKANQLAGELEDQELLRKLELRK
jgi:hypothetical protein